MAKQEEYPKKEQQGQQTQESGETQTQQTGQGQAEQQGQAQEGEGQTQEGQGQSQQGMLIAKVKEAYPDSEFNSDEEVIQAAVNYINDLEDWQSREMKANEEIRKAFDAQPEVGKLVKMITQGAGLRDALPYVLDSETIQNLTPAEGEPDYEAWKQNLDARQKELEEQEQADRQLEENIQATEQLLQEFASEQGMNDEEAQGFAQFLTDTIKEMLSGQVSKETMALLQKGKRYDDDVGKIEEAKKIREKNKQVEQQKQQREQGDGLPDTGNAGGSQQKQKEQKTEDKGGFGRAAEMFQRRKQL